MKKISLTRNFYIFLLLFSLYRWILLETVLGTTELSWPLIGLLLIWAFVLVIQWHCSSVNIKIFLWIPYIIYTIFGYIQAGNIEYAVYWVVVICVLMQSNTIDVYAIFPYRLVLVSGCILAGSVYFHFFFQDIYNQTLLKIFLNQTQIQYWARYGSYTGLSYQLGVTAIIILQAIAVWLCKENRHNLHRQYTIAQYIPYALLLMSILLTGKRSSFLAAVLLTLVVFFFSERSSSKRFRNILLVAICGTVMISIFYNNLEYFAETKLFGRLASTLQLFLAGEDITTGRKELYATAVELFKGQPVFGIGLGAFKRFNRDFTDVHNAFLQILCEQGVIGFVLFVIPLATILISSICSLKKAFCNGYERYIKYSLCLQIIYVVSAFSGNPNTSMNGFMLYFIGVSIYNSCMSRARKEQVSDIRREIR